MSAKKIETIELSINGQTVAARPGQTIYEVVSEQGLDDIPVLCHSPELKPYGSCFVCVVEVEGRPNLVPSCATRVVPGMVVQTNNERITASRQTALELLMSNHYADCIAPCVLGCPAHVDVQGYIALAGRGQFSEAADLIRLTNPLPAVCGRVCVRKCEEVCRRQLVDESVAINDLKRYITDAKGAYDSWPTRQEATGKRVAIVGAGPAGLTAAYYLGLKGHDCQIFEMMPEPGGMLRYGIPSYRLPREVLKQEVDYITSRSGSTLTCNKKLGKDLELGKLRADYDAVYLAMGAVGANSMHVEGEYDTEGVLEGLPWLMEIAADETKRINGTVVVIGGGNTAMDAARTANRIGADKVIVLYRRTRNEMPADDLEIVASLEEDIALIELAAPQELVKDKQGRLKAIKCIRMELGEPDASGRRRPVPIEGSEFTQNCEWCISAIGQSPILDGIDATDEENMPAVTKWNTLVADQATYATRVPGVFTGGDVETGPSVAIDCIAAGQRVSRSIHAFLLGESEGLKLREEDHMAACNTHTAPHCADCQTAIVMKKDLLAEVSPAHIGERPQLKRQSLPEIEPAERENNFTEVATGFTYSEARHEVPRCLSCGCLAVDDCRLREYCSQYDVELTKYAGTVRRYQVDDSHPHIVIDNNKCILCARCIRTCDQVLGESALSLVNRGFSAIIEPAMGKPLAETPCVSCGNCVAACPTGALTVKHPFVGRAVLPTKEAETTCAFCSLACTAKVKSAGEGRFWIEPPEGGGNHLCRFGRFGAELFTSQQRIKTPLIREGGDFVATSYEDAFNVIVSDLRRAIERYGPESVAVFVSPEMTNEQLYLAQRIAREGLGTNNIGSLSTLLTESAPNPLTDLFGFTASTADRSALDDADLVVMNNCDLKVEQLILAMDVIKQVQQRGCKVIHASSVHSDIQEYGTLNLEPFRGSATMMWQGVAQLVANAEDDLSSIEAMPGGNDFLKSVIETKFSDVLAQSGEDQHRLEYCAQLLKDAKNIVFIDSPDRTEDKAPNDLTQIGNLMSMLHALGKHVNLLLPRSASNTAGMETCGAAVEFMPGRQQVSAELKQITPSRDTLMKRVVNGEIKAALVLGEDPLRDAKVRRYLENIKYLAILAESMTETAHAADVILPGTNYLEEEGTRVNFEGVIHEFKSALAPPGGRQAWSVLCGLAGAFRVMTSCGAAAHVRKHLEEAVREGYGEFTPFFWNTGQPRKWSGPRAFKPVQAQAETLPVTHYLTSIQRYKFDAETIGMKHFRV